MFLFAAAIALTACSEQPQREVSADIVSIAPHPNPRWNANEMVVTARSPDGASGSKPVLMERLNCRVGDVVQASARGVSLTLDDRTCER
jgi:hypothetical protein